MFKEFKVPILCENMLSVPLLLREFLKSKESFPEWNFAAPPTFLTSVAAESMKNEAASEIHDIIMIKHL